MPASGMHTSFYKPCYITSRHTYRLKIAAEIFDANGTLVETVTDY